MNENQQRHLLVSFRHIDNLLSEAEHILANAGLTSPFAELEVSYEDIAYVGHLTANPR
jgi:hypothetical protein